MFPTNDMNPIAVRHMQQERLKADIDYIDRAERRSSPTARGLKLRVGGLAMALIVLVVAL